MKLKHIAMTAFALSMSAAFAATEAGNPQDNLADKNKPATAVENKVNGSGTAAADLSASTTASADVKKDKRSDNMPAGYADKSAAATPHAGQKDTKKAQKKQKKENVASADIAASGTSGAAISSKSDTPAGYADKSTTDKKKSGQKDTLKAQQQPDAGLGSSAAAPVRSGAPAGHADASSAAKGSQPQDTQAAQLNK